VGLKIPIHPVKLVTEPICQAHFVILVWNNIV